MSPNLFLQKCEQQHLDKLKEVKTPWVLVCASNSGHGPGPPGVTKGAPKRKKKRKGKERERGEKRKKEEKKGRKKGRKGSKKEKRKKES